MSGRSQVDPQHHHDDGSDSDNVLAAILATLHRMEDVLKWIHEDIHERHADSDAALDAAVTWINRNTAALGTVSPFPPDQSIPKEG